MKERCLRPQEHLITANEKCPEWVGTQRVNLPEVLDLVVNLRKITSEGGVNPVADDADLDSTKSVPTKKSMLLQRVSTCNSDVSEGRFCGSFLAFNFCSSAFSFCSQ
jgi:hypothetical protein